MEKPAERYYITPLLESFNILKSNLVKAYSMGKNFWMYPIGENKVFA